MQKREVLRGERQFNAVYKKGKSVGDKYVVVFYRKNDLGHNRTGVLASKKVGNAVQRNRARRLIKESLRKIYIEDNGYDIIVIARNSINGKKCGQVEKSLRSAVKKTKINRG